MEPAQKPDETRNFFGFLTSVSTILEQQAGIRYAEVSRSIHPNGHAPRHAFEGGVDAKTFVQGILADEGFRNVADDADARGFNLAQAAISEFVFATPGWHRSVDGTYFMPEEDKTLTIRPILNKATGQFGFGVEVRDGAIRPGETADVLGEVESRHSGIDIGTPVAEAVEHANSSSQLRR